ncbi:MAG: MG2 domain-containing protein [Elusimicrobiaceae bacterium]|nr:MG2 domain-containing protein [Elusimicrobiaceae bacterium]
MKKIIYLTALLILSSVNSVATVLADADKSFEENDFTAAKAAYEEILTTASDQELWHAQLRLVACQYHLGEFLQAATSLQKYPLPQDPLWQARFLLYRTYLANYASHLYNPLLNQNEINSAAAKNDPSQWTRQQWQSHIDQDFRRLWDLQSTLLEAPVQQEKLILDLADTDTKRIPTLFDFVVKSWIEYLQSNPQQTVAALPQPDVTYLGGLARLKHSPRKSTVYLISQILQTAASLPGDNRQNAREFWKTDSVLLPFTSHDFVIEKQDEALDYAVKQLTSSQTTTSGWWARFKNYFTAKINSTATERPDYAKGYTAWKLAEVLNTHKRYYQVLDVCSTGQKSEKSFFTQQCQQLCEQINAVELHPQTNHAPLNRQQPVLSLSGKNLKQVYVRIYPTSFDELVNLYKSRRNSKNIGSWHVLTQLDSRDVPTFLSRTPQHTQSLDVTYEEVGKPQTATLQLPQLKAGFYVVLLSTRSDFSADTPGIYGWVINATDLAVFVTAAIAAQPQTYVSTLSATTKTLKPNLFHIYTVNLKTGKPQPDTALRLLTQYDTAEQTAQTNFAGILDLPRDITLNTKNAADSYYLDVLAQNGPSTAYTTNPLYFSFQPQAPVLLFAQTDRAIYRPGQQVQLAAQAFERLPRGLKTLDDVKIQLNVTDPNGKNIFTKKLPVNKLGNIQTSFTLPQEGLLGRYRVSAELNAVNGRTYRDQKTIQVEEYKRPDYELTLNAPSQALAYNQKAVLSGNAQYYSGAALEKATVSYTVKRRSYRPPFYWWCWRPLPTQETILTQGQTKTDNKGSFQLSFTPTRQEEDEEFAEYTLEAQVRDESGRSISATRSYKISAHPHLFKLTFTQGFYDVQKPLTLAELDLTDADGNSVTGQVKATVQLLENRQPDTTSVSSSCYGCGKSSLEELYQSFAAQEEVFSQTLSFTTAGAQTLQLPPLAEGVYRLELTSEKASSQQMIFVVAQEKSSLKLPDVALVQQKTYYPGETLRVLVGAGNLRGSKRLEVYQQNQFLTYQTLLLGGAEVFSLPITQSHRGGLSLRWFGASDYVIHSAQTQVEVPFTDNQLTVQPQLPPYAAPGQTVRWAVDVKNHLGQAVNGLVNATVYDKSLDYYAPHTWPFQFKSLYTQRNKVASATLSSPAIGTVSYRDYKKEVLTRPNELSLELPLPELNLQMVRRFYTQGLRGASGGAKMMLSAAAPVMKSAANEQSLNLAVADTAEAAAPQQQDVPTTPVRTDFAETAFFNANVALTNGRATLNFTLPQSLTTWNVLGFALTQDAQLGTFSASTVTRKDLMVRLQMPRFYREADHGIIQAAVTNQTKRKLTTRVTLSLTNGQTSALQSFGITRPTQTVTVPPDTTRFVSWEITAPMQPDLYEVTAVARSTSLSDGEQKTLPVLPSKMRLLTSVHRALHNGTNILELNELSGVAPRDVELVALNLNPSLALSVLNDMPNLLSSPYRDLVSSLNRYVPLSVVHQFYTTYPQLKEAVKKLPRRTGQTPPWDEQDPLRLQLLEQTPWLRQAQGRKSHEENLISLFDDKIVSAYLDKELKNIARFQKSNGAFTWFAGGPDDEYLTLYALDSFAQALAYKATIPQSSAKKALAYLLPRIEENLQEDKTGSVGAVSYALYSAYVVSAFPTQWKEIAQAKKQLKKWVDYADSQAKFMTPLGQIYAAAVYHRLGEQTKADKYLDLVLSRLKEDPLTGAYFAPEPQSWIWYNDTLTTQAITLQTLLEMRPKSDKIQPLLQWFLFNRQVNDWTDSKAASQAVFTVLNVMQAQGDLSQASYYRLDWAGTNQKKTFQPLNWTEDLRFVCTGDQITPQAYTASIRRQGPQTTDFASLSAVYQAAEVKPSDKGVINVQRTYFLREKSDEQVKLRPLAETETVRVGDEVEVQLVVTTDSAFEYVLLQDPKPAGFESADLISGWKYQTISYYQEIKDAATHFFIDRLPHGTVTLRYILKPTVPGELHALPAQIQSMYAPQYGAHSDTTVFTVKE